MNTPIGEAAFIASTVARLFAPLRALVGMDDNPLAVGTFCPRCGTRLDKSDRPCPVCPSPRAYRLREHQRRAVVKVGVVGAGAVVYEGICANA